ncbi:MAG: hypothetical protein BWX86_02750 [Verrucomicrobia bacterium ADurb.Bin122]|nr:MAG: hypothetical protein BWX86_02750 [Verrucomicrobia bacterium ADurb.Bin122]
MHALFVHKPSDEEYDAVVRAARTAPTAVRKCLGELLGVHAIWHDAHLIGGQPEHPHYLALHVQRAYDHPPRLIAEKPLQIRYPALCGSAEASVAPKFSGMDRGQKGKAHFALESGAGQRRGPIMSMYNVERPAAHGNRATAGK